MSNLPHPLGDTNPGEIFYPGSPQVTVADAPGAAGSRAVEFGEDGYSSPINRMGYALAKNDEYQEDRLEAKVGRVEFTSWTPSGGNGDKYTFAAVDLFVGAADYLPETQKIRDSLISVLDGDYNELLDTNGDKVVVKSIQNNGETASIVGDPTAAGGDEDGFYNGGAVAQFQTVHPVTGAVQSSSYTIPNSTNVIFAHALASTLDTLATTGQEHLMRDAWVKGCIRNAHEIHAGTFLRDGSRVALGDFDMDTHKVITDYVQGHGSQALQIGDAAGEKIWFRDQWMSAMLNDAPTWNPTVYESGLYGIYNSILGSLNSAVETNSKWSGNRSLNRTGSFAYTPGSGMIDYPALDIQVNGEVIYIPAGNVNATNTGTTPEYTVVTSAGSVAVKAAGSVLTSDVVVEFHAWNGSAFASFDENDLRWPVSKRQNAMEITCGDGAGSDFANFDDAIIVGRQLARVGKEINQLKVRVIGTATWSSQIDLDSSLDAELCILGDGWENSKVNITAVGVGIDLDSTSSGTGVPIRCENVNFVYNNATDMTLWTYVFSGVGDGSRIKDCKFSCSAAGFGWGVLSSGTTSSNNIIVSGCVLEDWLDFVSIQSAGACHNVSILDCFGTCSSHSNAQVLIHLAGSGLRVMRCNFEGDWLGLVDIDNDTTADEDVVIAYNTCISTKAAADAFYGVNIQEFPNANITVAHNYLKNFQIMVNVASVSTGARFKIDILHNRFDTMNSTSSAWGVLFNSVSVTDQASINIRGNTFINTSTTISTKAFAFYGPSYLNVNVNITHNETDEGQAVYVDANGLHMKCNDNTFRAPTLVNGTIILTDGNYLQEGSQFCNNTIYRRAMTTNGINIAGVGLSICSNDIINTDVAPTFNVGQYDVGTGVNSVRDISATPQTKLAGYRYLVYDSATGDWAGQDGKIVEGDLTSGWDFYTPADQWMVWATDAFGADQETWYVHYGAHSGWGGTGGQGWYEADSIAISVSGGGDDVVGHRIRGNRIIGGIHGIVIGNQFSDCSVTDNFMRELLGYCVYDSGSYATRLDISHNHFWNCHGMGVENTAQSSANVIYVSSSTEEAHVTIVANHFERCGHRWEYEDEGFMISVSGNGSGLIANNFISQIQGCDDDTFNVIYVQGRTDVIGNRITHEYNKSGGVNSEPYGLNVIRINNDRCVVSCNHISITGTATAADWIQGIYVQSGASYGSLIGNLINIEAVGSLSTYEGIDCDGAGWTAVGNSSGDDTVGMNQSYDSATYYGFSACNYAHAGAVSGSNQHPDNGIAAPIDLWDELNL